MCHTDFMSTATCSSAQGGDWGKGQDKSSATTNKQPQKQKVELQKIPVKYHNFFHDRRIQWSMIRSVAVYTIIEKVVHMLVVVFK